MGCNVEAFRNLIFEGGGVKGIAFGGALDELENMGTLSHITRVAGTSAGAITAALLALGYSASGTSEIIAGTNFNQFADHSRGFFRDAIRLLKQYGWHKGNAFWKWIGKLVARKTGREDLTFGQLKERTGQNGFRDLYVVATNLTDQVAEVFSHETTPDLEIRNAVRMSMSIPLYFRCVRRAGDVIVDGGVTWNYPINLFDYKKYLDKKSNGQAVDYNPDSDYVFNHETLGFRLDSKDEITYNAKGWANVPQEIRGFSDYAIALVSFLQESANKRHLHNNDWKRTVFVDTLGVKTTDFDLSSSQIKALIDSGVKGVAEHFKWRNGAKGMSEPK